MFLWISDQSCVSTNKQSSPFRATRVLYFDQRGTVLTEDLHLDGGLSLLVAVLRHTLVDAGVVHGGVVDGEGGGGFVAAAHENVLPVGEDLLPAGSVPVDVFGIAHHWKRREN